jgi:hypothetical protein
MSRRLALVFVAALVFAARTFAQPPEEIRTAPTPMEVLQAPPLVAAELSSTEVGEPRFWATGEYLFGWVRGAPLPPLVTTSPAGVPRADAGVIGLPLTTTLFGDERVNEGMRNGARITGGLRFGAADELGIETGFFLLETESTPFAAASTGVPILARPFFNVATNSSASVLVTFPGSSAGSIDILARSGNLFGGNLDFTERFYEDGRVRLSSLLGYRFLRFDEGLRLRQTVLPTGPGFVPGTVIASEDSFSAQNEFHGVDIGLRTELYGSRWSLELLTKIAAGNLRREISIRGSQTTSVPGTDPTTSVGGVLALASNIGKRSSDDWIAVPEVGLSVSRQLSERVCVRLGYAVLYWEETARAGNQVDLRINPNLFPPVAVPTGPQLPAAGDRRSDLWVQTLNLGLDFRY